MSEDECLTHIPVLLDEILVEARAHLSRPRFYFDGTFGRGGHASALKELFPTLEIFAFDKDLDAVEYASSLSGEMAPKKIWHEDFRNFKRYLEGEFQSFLQGHLFDLMLIDLGVSSPQLDTAHRGFSFYHEGPLDMRMNQNQEVGAAEIVNEWEESELIELFRSYGEIRNPNRVVRAILERREIKPFETTLDLAGLIEATDGWRKKGKHPATQYSLALRMQVNEAPVHLESALRDLIEGLAPKGLLMVITFHSLEDRIVKNLFKEITHLGEPLYKKVIQPKWADTKKNPRARSAKLRIFRRGDLQ